MPGRICNADKWEALLLICILNQHSKGFVRCQVLLHIPSLLLATLLPFFKILDWFYYCSYIYSNKNVSLAIWMQSEVRVLDFSKWLKLIGERETADQRLPSQDRKLKHQVQEQRTRFYLSVPTEKHKTTFVPQLEGDTLFCWSFGLFGTLKLMWFLRLVSWTEFKLLLWVTAERIY